MDQPSVRWPAAIQSIVEEGILTEHIGIENADKNETRKFQVGDHVAVLLPHGVSPQDLDQNEPVQILAHPFEVNDNAISRVVAKNSLTIGTRSMEQKKDIELELEGLKLLPLPGPLVAESTLEQLVRVTVLLLHQNSAIIRNMSRDSDVMDYLHKYRKTIASTIWNATDESVMAYLDLGLQEAEVFSIDESLNRFQQATGTLRPGKGQRIPDGAAVFLETLNDKSTKAFRIDYALHLRDYFRNKRQRQYKRQDLIKENTRVNAYILCSFPFGTSRKVLKLAADVYSLILGSYCNAHAENPNLNAIEAVKNPKTHMRYLQVAILRRFREHLFSDLGCQLQVKGNPLGLNSSMHSLKARSRAASANETHWFMVDHGEFRRYFKSAPVDTSSEDSKKGRINLGNGMPEIGIPKAFLINGRPLSPVWTVIDITKNKTPHRHPFAGCPVIGPLDNMQEANAVSISCIAQSDDNGWTGSYASISSDHLYKLVDYAGIEIPIAYVACMKIINTLENPTYIGELPDLVKPSDANGRSARSARIVELRKSWLDHKDVLRLMLGSIDEQPRPVPRITSLAMNQALLEDLPGVVFGNRLEGSRKICDMCYLYSRGWQLSPNDSELPVEPARRCDIKNGICTVWSWQNVPATWSTYDQLPEILRRIGFGSVIEEEVPADGMLPTEILDEKHRTTEKDNDDGGNEEDDIDETEDDDTEEDDV